MELFSVSTIKDILKIYEARPLKQFGQHFLINKSVLKKIIEASNISSQDIILEIGPGIGVLTQELVKKAGKVIAIEKDSKMVEILKKTLKGSENVKIVQEDILKYEVGSKGKRREKKLQTPDFGLQTSYKVVANLPYYIVSPVIRRFLEEKVKPKEMILMVQKEVAQRICAKPPDMNLLAVSVQFYSKAEIVSYVSKNSFWPKPKVDGAILKITPQNNLRRNVLRRLFFKVVRAGFSQPRKQLCNNLKNGLKLNKTEVKDWLLKNGVSPKQRAESLNLEDWINLTKSFKYES